MLNPDDVVKTDYTDAAVANKKAGIGWASRNKWKQGVESAMWRDQAAFEVNMWNATNEYNDYSSQIQRALNAGINPNSILQGIDASASSVNNPSMNAQEAQGVEWTDALGAISNAASSASGMADTILNQQQRESQIKLNEAQASALNVETQGKYQEQMMNAIYSPQERSLGIQNLSLDAKQKSQGLINMKIELRNLKLTGDAQKIANDFAVKNYDWILNEKNPQELKNLGAAFDQMKSAETANRAAANASNASAEASRANAAYTGTLNETAKRQQDAIVGKSEADAEKAAEDAAYMQFRNACYQNNVDPDAEASVRAWQGYVNEWKKSPEWYKKGGAYAAEGIGAVLRVAGSTINGIISKTPVGRASSISSMMNSEPTGGAYSNTRNTRNTRRR